ncbi:MAG: hypothetical protein CXT71_05125 [Methanobacteriota archaeon]|jgi:molybdopterin converting factor small subunit|nr:MAG: hypothetical protein CXT71_05125 [Euryarchaeota archaeon]HIL65918.1 MoaD/ThiS family protein [Candidatus Poseidoniales archaeon]
MKVRVLVFGPIAEALGAKQHDIELPESSSACFLIEELRQEHWLNRGLIISVNGHIVNADEPLAEGDEIALLPPVSGG